MNRRGLSLQHLLCYAEEGEDPLNRIVTGDESCVHHYEPESKQHPTLPPTRRCKVTPSAGKVMLTVFWILRDYTVEASGCNWQKTSRPTGKRDTASS
jgi:hypothetical protein